MVNSYSYLFDVYYVSEIFSFCQRIVLQAGTLIYVRVVKANPGLNPELSCTDGWFLLKKNCD